MGSFSKADHARLCVAFSNGSLVQAPKTMKPERATFKRTEDFFSRESLGYMEN
jgi:hypothetical protein